MITGGGTGGHVYPALALADELVARGHPRDAIRFVGARRGLEARVVPAAGYAIDLLPGRGLQRRFTVANLRAAWDTLTAFAHGRAASCGGRGRASWSASAATRRCPDVVAARLRRVPYGRPRAERRPRTRQPHRRAPGRPRRGVAARHAAAGRGAHRQPGARRDRGRAAEPGPGAPARRRVRRQPGCGPAQRRRPRAVRPVARPRRRRRPPRDGHAQLRGVRGAPGGGCAAPTTRCATSSSPTRTTWTGCTRARRSPCAGPARSPWPSSPPPASPRCSCPLPGAPGDHQTRNAEALVAAGAAVVVPDARVRRHPARRGAARRCSPTRDGSTRCQPTPRALGATRRRRPARRPRRGGGTVDGRDPRTRARPHVAPARAHRRHRRRGDERDRDRARPDGPPRHRLRPQGVARRSTGSGSSASMPSVGHRAENVPPTSTPWSSRPPSPTRTPRSARPTNAACPCCDGPRRSARSAATRRTVAVAGSHGKTTTSSMLALILRAAGWQPSFIIGGDLNEVGTNAAYDDGEWLVVEADESDGTFLELAPEGGHRHQRRARPPRPLRRLRRAHRGVRASSSPASRACASCAPTTRSRAGSPPRIAGAVTYGLAEDATYRIDSYEGGGDGSRFELHRDGRELGAIDLPVPGRHNAANAAGAAALALELGVPFEAVGRSAARLRRRRAPVPVPRRGRRRHARRRLRAPPRRDRGDDRRGAGGRLGPRDRRLPAPPVHAHRPSLARLRRRVHRRRRGRAHRRVRRRRDTAARRVGPAHPAARCSTPIRRCRSSTCRGAPTWCSTRCGSPGPATSC